MNALMARQISADLLKARSAPTLLALSALVIVAPLLIVFMTGLTDDLAPLGSAEATHVLLPVGVAGALGCAFYGSYLVTRDEHYRAMERCFLMAPPLTVFASRVIVAMVAGFALSAVGFLIWTSVAGVILASDGRELIIGPHLAWVAIGNIASGTLAAALGCGIGWMVRNYYLAVIVLLILPSIIGAPMLGRLRDVERFLPVGAVAGLGGVHLPGLLGQPWAALVLAGWTASALAAGWVSIRRRARV